MLFGLDLSPLWSPLGLLLLGLCAGSFINVVAHRLPTQMARGWWRDTAWQLESGEGLASVWGERGEPAGAARQRGELSHALHTRLNALPAFDLNRPRSHCPACGHVLRWHENLPVLGWLRLKGRCSACGVRIPARYPLVEGATALLFLVMGWRFGFEPTALLWCGWVGALVALSLIDWDTTLLPDTLTLPLLWSGLLVAALGWTLPLADAVWGVLWGYGGLWALVWVFERVTGKQAMGGGDFKLLAGLGAWMGPTALLPIVFIASIFGAAVGLVMKARGSLREGRYVPFGPFLAGAAVVVAVVGTPKLWTWVGL